MTSFPTNKRKAETSNQESISKRQHIGTETTLKISVKAVTNVVNVRSLSSVVTAKSSRQTIHPIPPTGSSSSNIDKQKLRKSTRDRQAPAQVYHVDDVASYGSQKVTAV